MPWLRFFDKNWLTMWTSRGALANLNRKNPLKDPGDEDIVAALKNDPFDPPMMVKVRDFSSNSLYSH